MNYVLIAREKDFHGTIQGDTVQIKYKAKSPEDAAEKLTLSYGSNGALVEVFEMSNEPVATFDVVKKVKVEKEVHRR